MCATQFLLVIALDKAPTKVLLLALQHQWPAPPRPLRAQGPDDGSTSHLAGTAKLRSQRREAPGRANTWFPGATPV